MTPRLESFNNKTRRQVLALFEATQKIQLIPRPHQPKSVALTGPQQRQPSNAKLNRKQEMGFNLTVPGQLPPRLVTSQRHRPQRIQQMPALSLRLAARQRWQRMALRQLTRNQLTQNHQPQIRPMQVSLPPLPRLASKRRWSEMVLRLAPHLVATNHQ